MRPLRRDERGLSESVQYAVVFPVLMLVTLGIIQAGLWIHGQSVAARAAHAAVDAARGSYGTTNDAQALGTRLAAAGGLDRVQVRVTATATDVQATVTGTAPVLLDLGLGRVRETASAPKERVTRP